MTDVHYSNNNNNNNKPIYLAPLRRKFNGIISCHTSGTSFCMCLRMKW